MTVDPAESWGWPHIGHGQLRPDPATAAIHWPAPELVRTLKETISIINVVAKKLKSHRSYI